MGSSGEAFPLILAFTSRCLVDGRLDGASSAFLAPRPRPDVLRFTLDAFRFAGDTGDSVSNAEQGFGQVLLLLPSSTQRVNFLGERDPGHLGPLVGRSCLQPGQWFRTN